MENIFLIGGYDLEMITIRELLLRNNIRFLDKHLQWNNAYIDEYAEEIKDYANNEKYRIYAIELNYKNIVHIDNLEIIDHHNKLSGNPSALEQVAGLLGTTMDRKMKLIAANDREYIPGLMKLGATNEEIMEIRLADRKAQGVTDEDESKAEKAIKAKKTYNGLIVVESETGKFSPICDRLFPYRKLIVFNDYEFVYYGEDSEIIYRLATDFFGIGNIYYGGGRNGYIGLKKGTAKKQDIKLFIDKVTQIQDGNI